MRAVVFDEFGQEPSVRAVEPPTCPPDGAIVRVAATGLCRSDWHAWQGHDETVRLPHVPGHELAGTVERVGRDVRRWHEGTRVTAPFVCACGDCAQCQEGEHQVCSRQTQPGFTHWGSFAEQVLIRHADVNLVELPDGLGFVDAASLGCRFATAYRAVTVHGAVRPGQWVAVHGCGGVGLSTVQAAVALGARVLAVDVSASARERATALGAEVAVDVTDSDPYEIGRRIRELTGGGADVSLDAFGSILACVASVESLRPRGRHVQVGLLAGPDALPAAALRRVIAEELALFGSHGMGAVDYPPMLSMVRSGALRPDLLVGEVIGLDQAPGALAAMSDARSPGGITVIRVEQLG